MAKKSMIAKAQKRQRFKVRRYNRCEICGRSRGYMRKFAMCRICFRQRAGSGLIPGGGCEGQLVIYCIYNFI